MALSRSTIISATCCAAPLRVARDRLGIVRRGGAHRAREGRVRRPEDRPHLLRDVERLLAQHDHRAADALVRQTRQPAPRARVSQPLRVHQRRVRAPRYGRCPDWRSRDGRCRTCIARESVMMVWNGFEDIHIGVVSGRQRSTMMSKRIRGCGATSCSAHAGLLEVIHKEHLAFVRGKTGKPGVKTADTTG